VAVAVVLAERELIGVSVGRDNERPSVASVPCAEACVTGGNDNNGDGKDNNAVAARPRRAMVANSRAAEALA